MEVFSKGPAREEQDDKNGAKHQTDAKKYQSLNLQLYQIKGKCHKFEKCSYRV